MKRACETLLGSYLETFPCVAIVGLRQCGKTTLLGTLPKTWKQLDLERRADREVVTRDPDAFFRLNPTKVALDEAQLAPELVPALPVSIDALGVHDASLHARLGRAPKGNPATLPPTEE